MYSKLHADIAAVIERNIELTTAENLQRMGFDEAVRNLQ
jgi:hypothetical protein